MSKNWENFGERNVDSHYTTGPAARILTHGLPQQFTCRVTLNGRELPVESAGGSISGQPAVATLVVDLENRDLESVDAIVGARRTIQRSFAITFRTMKHG